MKNKQDIVKQMEAISENLSDDAYFIFTVATEAIMEAVPEGSVSQQDILAGLKAIVAIAELQASTSGRDPDPEKH